MSKKTEEFKAAMAEKLAELEREEKILNTIPDGAKVSFVCNIVAPDEVTPRAWVVLESPSYDPDNKFDPVGQLRAMEAAGWAMIDTAAVVVWDNYRGEIVPCTTTEAALYERPRHTYQRGDDTAAYWLTPNGHTKPEFCAYMRGPDGSVYRVQIAVPSLRVRLSARRHEYTGGWYYESGTGQLHTPEAWPVARSLSRAYVDTEQGLSGVVYFDLLTRKDAASAALSSLLDSQK